MSPTHRQGGSEPVAIIGMACRFAGDATSPSKLWDLCVSGRDAWSPVPKERFDAGAHYHPDKEKRGRNHAKGGYFLSQDIAAFDAAFFNLTAEVARALDPQIRLLLESVYEATEDAGIPINHLAGSDTSVYTGTYSKDYHDQLTRDPGQLPPSFITGNATSMLSNRIAHFYDLHGPSMSIDTACSSGMVALHHAVQSIRSGDSTTSIVGAASALLNPDMFISQSTIGFLGGGGRCFAWDSRAEGYGRGEGVATLILKSLEDAVRDGDRVHAVIRETGLNQDGKTPTITSPSSQAQIDLIEACYRRAGLDLSETAYVDGHMTGTKAGDAAEAEALGKTFGKRRSAEDPLLVGSVKTNIGHTEPVSGLAAVIKTVSALKHGIIPSNLNFKMPGKADLQRLHLRVPTELTPWPTNKPLRASVNNFGIGGTNAHAILEAFLNQVQGQQLTNGETEHESRQVFLFSAKDPAVAAASAKALATWVRAGKARIKPADLAYTLSERRSWHPWRIAVSAVSLNDLSAKLEQPGIKASHIAATKPRIGFVFNGQGAQWHAMGRELISAYPVFRKAIQEADQILKEHGAEWSLIEELMRDAKSTRVSEVELSQPISVALQLCLVELLTSWDVRPAAVTSHSSGEIAAAYAVGALSFREALGVVYHRGRLGAKHRKLSTVPGGMLAVGLGPNKAREYLLNDKVVVACINSPDSVTLSGDLQPVEEVLARLEADGVFARKLKVPLAYHSHHMQSMAPEYAEVLRSIASARPGWTGALFTSPVTGKFVMSPQILPPEHWVENLTNPVLFSQAFREMCFGQNPATSNVAPDEPTRNVDAVVEIGAHGTLAGPINQILKAEGAALPYATCLRRSENAVETMQELACNLIEWGYPVKLKDVNSPNNEVRKLVDDLPTYAWNHKTRYWLEPRISREIRNPRFPPHELVGSPLAGGNGAMPTWRNLQLGDVAWLKDHRVNSAVVVGAATFVSMAVEGLRLLSSTGADSVSAYHLKNVEFQSALEVPQGSSNSTEVILSLSANDGEAADHEKWNKFSISTVDGDSNWIEHARGFAAAVTSGSAPGQDRFVALPDLNSFSGRGEKPRDVNVDELFKTFHGMGIEHGPTFKNLISGKATAGKAVLKLDVTEALAHTEDYVLHPTILDSILQTAYTCIPDAIRRHSVAIPQSIEELYIAAKPALSSGSPLHVVSERTRSRRTGFTSKITAISPGNTQPVHVEGFYIKAIPRPLTQETEVTSVCSKISWEPDILHNIPTVVKSAMRRFLTDDEKATEDKLMRVAYHMIHDAVSELETEGQESWQWHHKIFYEWMRSVVAQAAAGTLAPRSKMWARTSKGMKRLMADELDAVDAAGRMTVRVGRNLARIVRGDVTPLEIMTADGLLTQYYEDMPRLKHRTYIHLSKIAELFAAKNPGAAVLEVGGGTGGATTAMLEGFAAKGNGANTLLGRYTFTDISSGFFDAAKTKLAAWGDLIEFKKLDIEVDPVEQTFTPGTYDLVMASMALHATKSLVKTMRHVRKMLKPGGKLVMIEPDQDRLDVQLMAGTLPGWWLSEEPQRKSSPSATLEMWTDVLREAGYSGIDFSIGDCEEPEYHSMNVILATAVPAEPPAYPLSVSIAYVEAARGPWLAELAGVVKDIMGITPTLSEVGDVHAQTGSERLTIVADARLGSLSAGSNLLKKLVSDSQAILWLASHSPLSGHDTQYAHLADTLSSLRKEHPKKRIVSLGLGQSASSWDKDDLSALKHVIKASFDKSVEVDEWEYIVKDGSLHVPRIYPDRNLDAVVSTEDVDPPSKQEPFLRERDHALVWQPGLGGLVDDPHFTPDYDSLESALPKGSLEIEVRAFGIGSEIDESRDLQGYDFAGNVKRLGADTEGSGLKIGDKVCGIAQGDISSIVRGPAISVAKLLTGISWTTAASLPTPSATAHYALFKAAQLQKGESALIVGATTPVGQAAIHFAQDIGAKIFATCGSAEEQQLLATNHGLGKEQIISTGVSVPSPRDSGHAFDVVLQASNDRLLLDLVSPFGRYIDCSGNTDARKSLDLTPLHQRSATYVPVDILQLSQYRGKLVQDSLVASLQSLKPHCSASFSVEQFSLADLDKAVRKATKPAVVGVSSRVVVIPAPEDYVKVVHRPRPIKLDAEASYVVIGEDVDGMTESVVSWMVDNGAKHVVTALRADKSLDGAAAITKRAESEGCTLRVVHVDTASPNSICKAVGGEGVVPTVRGIVGLLPLSIETPHTALENITKQYQDVEFFVLISQAEHASVISSLPAALAKARAAQGHPTTALDIIGTVAEPTMLRLLDTAVSNSSTHIIAGLTSHETLSEDLKTYHDRRYGTLRLADPQSRRKADSAPLASGAQDADRAAAPLRALAEQPAVTEAQATTFVTDAVVAKLEDMFGAAEGEVDARQPPSRYGVDSLVAVELRNWLESAARARLTVSDIVGSKSLGELGRTVAGRSELVVGLKA
ncbi:uncharacterized protein E0L32_010999 [Thyridium curvatum]|uniref:Uncharacterized protein n=1 Tax=Thyridium curvatum TaxID=1093900 RepID=A0A507ALR3_9PEZI|nr:uncharacterized protein E0L32_010999 [Thyridium curvatum]TPX07104.1 hypothetical protein E0L32_010999 [Thyridium curvatum]